MRTFPKKPRTGENSLRGIYRSVCQIIDYLPTLTVYGDGRQTSVSRTINGTIVHAKTEENGKFKYQGDYPKYIFGQGLTAYYDMSIISGLSGISKEEAPLYVQLNIVGDNEYISACYPSSINDPIEIKYIGPQPSGGGGGGGGGTTYYADNYSLSSINSSTFYTYDVLPFLTGAGGVQVLRYGSAPGIADRWGEGEEGDDHQIWSKAKGTVISCPYYVGVSGIGILDDTTPGTYNKYVAITADFDYHAGSGISIDPATRTINCTVQPGGGGSYSADNFTIKLSGDASNIFYVNCISSLLTGAGGTGVYYYGTDLGGTVIAGISSYMYLPSTGIAIIDGQEGTLTKYIAVTGGVSTPIQPGSGLISTAHYDPNGNPYVPTGYTFDLSAHFYNDLISLSGRHNFAGGVILSSYAGTLSWQKNDMPTKLSELTNDVGYITSPGPAPTAYYADNDTLSTTSNGTTFYVRNISTLLTGAGGTTVYYYGTGLNNTIVAGISSVNYLPSTGIAILDDTTVGSYNKYIAVTGDFITSTWVADNFISGGSTGDHMYYNSQEKLLKCMLTGGTNIEIEDIGNYGYINCTLTGLDQLQNTPGFITSPGPTPTAYYADNDTLSTTSNGTKFYVRNVSSLLTGAGGTTVYYYGTGLNNTIVAGISSYTYLPSTGIAILDDTTEGTCNKYVAVTGDYLDSSYYTFTNGLSSYNVLDANNNVIGQNVGLVETYRTILNTLSSSTTNANHNKVLSSSNNGTISWQTNTSNVPTPVANRVLSANSSNQMVWTTNTAGGGGGGGSSSGIPWPNYANLDNSTGNAIMLKTRYQAGSAGGWLRISYKGPVVDNCYYVKIGPDGNNDPQIGLWRVEYGQGEVGNTWLLPVPPDNYFYVSFPNSVATAWFDASVSQDSPQPIPPSAYNYPADIEHNYGVVVDYYNAAQGYKNEAEYQESRIEDASDYYQADEYASEAESNANWAEENATNANEYATESETKNAVLISYGITSSTEKTQQTRSKATETQTYATQARQAATRARAAANAFPH